MITSGEVDNTSALHRFYSNLLPPGDHNLSNSHSLSVLLSISAILIRYFTTIHSPCKDSDTQFSLLNNHLLLIYAVLNIH
ncbi:hypothetical protein TNIN_487051 [Trichonephila inaurata madagascariensis]|uniref:Uncharacterized protein n=1 Tax=Trichonephila inaurata madagascariensis TaxID=2747483 RepID=A0A8X6JSL3_9ARAC|nr:hypothetical protein TNIN_487051 [Trichonephila inaurata madagascariensis]